MKTATVLTIMLCFFFFSPTQAQEFQFAPQVNYRVGFWANSLVPLDLDQNGTIDLARIEPNGKIELYLNDGNGNLSFSESVKLTVELVAYALVGDVNGDRLPDVVVSDLGDHVAGIHVLMGNGAGGFEAVRFYSSPSIAVGQGLLVDYDRDGDLDFIATTRSARLFEPDPAGFIAYFNNDGHGVFTGYEKGIHGQGTSAIFTTGVHQVNDSVLVVTGFGGGGHLIYLSTDSLEVVRSERLPKEIDSSLLGDVNGDGRADLVGVSGRNLTILLADSAGFQPPVFHRLQKGGFFFAMGDLDNDSIDEIVMPGGEENMAHIYALKDGSLLGPVRVGTPMGNIYPAGSRLPVIADLNRDGLPDLIVDSDGSNDESFFAVMINQTVVTAIESINEIPVIFQLRQNYPNPFNPSTNIRFDLPVAGHATLKIYNAIGQEVATIVNGVLNAGAHSVMLDAGDLAAGVYYYRLRIGDVVQTRRLVLLK